MYVGVIKSLLKLKIGICRNRSWFRKDNYLHSTVSEKGEMLIHLVGSSYRLIYERADACFEGTSSGVFECWRL